MKNLANSLGIPGDSARVFTLPMNEGQPALLERLLHAMLPAGTLMSHLFSFHRLTRYCLSLHACGGSRCKGERLSWPLKELLCSSLSDRTVHMTDVLKLVSGKSCSLHTSIKLECGLKGTATEPPSP